MISIHDLARDGRYEEVCAELDLNPLRVNERNSANETPIFKAVWKDHLCVVELLLDRDANINAQNEVLRTPMHAACIMKRNSICLLLAQRGADLNIQSNAGRTALEEAGSDTRQVVEDFLYYESRYPLIHAVKQQVDQEKLQLLLTDSSTRINAQDYNGETALIYSSGQQESELVHQLLLLGADPNVANNDDFTCLHAAIANDKIKNAVLLVNHLAPIAVRTKSTNKAAFDLFKDKASEEQFFVTASEFSLAALMQNMSILWFTLIQLNLEGIGDKILHYVASYPELAQQKDSVGRVAVDVATPHIKKLLQSVFLWFGRYELIDPKPEHTSATCFVFRAKDQVEKDEKGEPLRVALKLMSEKSQFLREVTARRLGFAPEFVCAVLNTFPEVDEHDGSCSNLIMVPPEHEHEQDSRNVNGAPCSKLQAECLYCVVMPLADRNMYVALKQERWAGGHTNSSLSEVKHIFLQLLHCVNHLHSKGLVHGDIKTLNIVRKQQQWMLIDLDASCRIGIDYVCAKFSSAYVPPEVICEAGNARIFVASGNPFDECIRTIAHPSFDVWALGCVLYQICNPEVRPLFSGGQDDNLSSDADDEDNLWLLRDWSESTKAKKLSKVPDPLARNLLSQILVKDPSQRPSIPRILAHSFLSGIQSARLVGEDPLYDLFISYRVASDLAHAQRLYESLTQAGLRVWFDKQCLLPGVPWKEGFCQGLVKSAAFVCLLSRNAINHPQNQWQNFSSLHRDASCDNVFLEHRFALELKKIGLIGKVFPVLIGDFDEASKTYSNFFQSGCLPKAPNVLVTSVEEELFRHMELQGLGTPVLPEASATVSAVLTDILSHQGILIEGLAEEAFRAAVASICTMCDEAKINSKGQEKAAASKEDVEVVEEAKGGGAEIKAASVLSLSLQDKLDEYKRENAALSRALASLKEELRVARLQQHGDGKEC